MLRAITAFLVVTSMCGTVVAQRVTAHFIEVGQADSTLIEFPCGAVLIDAGAQTDEHVESLVSYLQAFFSRRTDLNNTLAAVYITHNHIDRRRGLRAVCENFNVARYFDNGQLVGWGPETRGGCG